MDLPRRARAAGAAVALVLAGCGGAGQSAPRAHSAAQRFGVPRPGSAGALFVSTGCGDCHTLHAAGARGRSGPDFDTSEVLTRRQIRIGILEGANGMPSYKGRLPARGIDRLTSLIATAMGRRHG